MKFLSGIFFLCAFVFSCNSGPSANAEKPVARVGDVYLYFSEFGDVVSGLNPQDSLETVKKYLNNWIREMLLLQQAEKNLKDDKKEFERMVDDYRKSLITYQYESQLIKQKLDTVVTDEEIEAYYIDNKDNFQLLDNIIKVIYVKVRKNAPKVEKVKEWYRSEDIQNRDALTSYCHQYAENFYLDENNWLLFEDVLKEIPIKLYDKEAFLQNNRSIETQDSAYFYFVNIKGFMVKNSASPLSFEKENIRSIIVNKRKVEMIKKMREDIYAEGVKNKTFEIYE